MYSLIKFSPTVIPVILVVILYLGGNKYFADSDNDGVNDITYNCPDVSNPTQTDSDNDKIGMIVTVQYPLKIILTKTIKNNSINYLSLSLDDSIIFLEHEYISSAECSFFGFLQIGQISSVPIASGGFAIISKIL